MEIALVIIFTFGIGIFTYLSRVESVTWRLIFRGDSNISDINSRRVHSTLKKLTTFLPASNGLVIASSLTLMILQGLSNSWVNLSVIQLTGWTLILFYIVAIRKNPLSVKAIRSHSSKAEDISIIHNDIKRLGIDHHLGLIANIFGLILQLMIWNK